MIDSKTWYPAYIVWFDNLSGVGVVAVPKLDRRITIHYAAALSPDGRTIPKKDRFDFVTFRQFDRVLVRILEDSHFTQVMDSKNVEWCTLPELLSDLIMCILETGAPNGTQTKDNMDRYLANILYICNRVEK